MDDSPEEADFGFKIDAVFSLATEEADDSRNENVTDDTELQTGSNSNPPLCSETGLFLEKPITNNVSSPIIIPQGCKIKPCKVKFIDILHEKIFEEYAKRIFRSAAGNSVKVEKEEEKECKNFDVIFAEGASYERGQRKRKANVLVKGPDFIEGTKGEITNVRKLSALKSIPKFTKFRGLKISPVVLKQNKVELYERFKSKVKGSSIRVDTLNEIAEEALLRPSREAPVQIRRRRQVARTKKKLRLCKREDDPYPPPPKLEPSGAVYRDYIEDDPPVLQPAMLEQVAMREHTYVSPRNSEKWRKRTLRQENEYILSQMRKVAKVTPMQNRSGEARKDIARQDTPTLQSLLSGHRMYNKHGMIVPTSRPPGHGSTSTSGSASSPTLTAPPSLATTTGVTAVRVAGHAVGTSEFTNTVNKLAKKENTKKFFQLKVGDKIILIPTDGLSVMPKAFVLDAAMETATATPAEDKFSSGITESAQNAGHGPPKSTHTLDKSTTSTKDSAQTAVHDPTTATPEQLCPSSETTFTSVIPKQEPMDESEMPSFDTSPISETHSQELPESMQKYNETTLPSAVDKKPIKVLKLPVSEPKLNSSTHTTSPPYPISYRSILPRGSLRGSSWDPPPTIVLSENSFKTQVIPSSFPAAAASTTKTILPKMRFDIQDLAPPRELPPPDLERSHSIVQEVIAQQKQHGNNMKTTSPSLRGPANERLGTIIVRKSPTKALISLGNMDTVKKPIKFIKFDYGMKPSATKLDSTGSLATIFTTSSVAVSSSASYTLAVSSKSTVTSISEPSLKSSTFVSTTTSIPLPASNTVLPSVTSFSPSSNVVTSTTPLLSSNAVVSSPIATPTPTSSVTSGIPLPDGTYAYFILPNSQGNQQNVIVYTDNSDPVYVPSAIPKQYTTVSACTPSTATSAKDTVRSLIQKVAKPTVTTAASGSSTSHTIVTSDSKSIITVYPPTRQKTAKSIGLYPIVQGTTDDVRLSASNTLKYISNLKKADAAKLDECASERLIVNMPFKSSAANNKNVEPKETTESSENSVHQQHDFNKEPESESTDDCHSTNYQPFIKQEPEDPDSYQTDARAQPADDGDLQQPATSGHTDAEMTEVAQEEVESCSSKESELEDKKNVENEEKYEEGSDTESESETKSTYHLEYENVTNDNGNVATTVTESVPTYENEMDEKIRKLKEMLRIQREKVEKLRQSKLINDDSSDSFSERVESD